MQKGLQCSWSSLCCLLRGKLPDFPMAPGAEGV